MSGEAIFAGLDVAKATCDVALRPTGEGWQVANDELGIHPSDHYVLHSTWPHPVCRGDHVWSTERDAAGVQYVVRYRIVTEG